MRLTIYCLLLVLITAIGCATEKKCDTKCCPDCCRPAVCEERKPISATCHCGEGCVCCPKCGETCRPCPAKCSPNCKCREKS